MDLKIDRINELAKKEKKTRRLDPRRKSKNKSNYVRKYIEGYRHTVRHIEE